MHDEPNLVSAFAQEKGPFHTDEKTVSHEKRGRHTHTLSPYHPLVAKMGLLVWPKPSPQQKLVLERTKSS